MKTILYILMIGLISSCSNPKMNLNRNPSSQDIIITKDKLKTMSPKEIIMLLKEVKTGQMVFFETIKNRNWTEDQMNEVKVFLGDQTPIFPVIKTTANIDCTDDKYLSTVDREARHLLMAHQAGSYPQAQCSTYDLDL